MRKAILNIPEKLEEAGCRVIYGLNGYKSTFQAVPDLQKKQIRVCPISHRSVQVIIMKNICHFTQICH